MFLWVPQLVSTSLAVFPLLIFTLEVCLFKSFVAQGRVQIFMFRTTRKGQVHPDIQLHHDVQVHPYYTMVFRYALMYCRYTLMAEFCGEAGRKYAFISGWVWWVFGMTGALRTSQSHFEMTVGLKV
jgi:hypothetical protein